MGAPWTLDSIRDHELDIAAIMVREVEVVTRQRIGEPIGCVNEGPLIIVPILTSISGAMIGPLPSRSISKPIVDVFYSISSIRWTSGRPAMKGPIAAPKVLK